MREEEEGKEKECRNEGRGEVKEWGGREGGSERRRNEEILFIWVKFYLWLELEIKY